MISIQRAHYLFKVQADMVDSLNNRDFNSAEIDEFLNRALFKWFSNNYKSFEINQEQIDKLSKLVVRYPIEGILPPITTYDSNTIYEFDLTGLPSNYAHAIRANVSAESGSCVKDLYLDIVEHDDLNYLLNNPYKSPSIKWNRALGTFGLSSGASNGRSILVYTKGNFTVVGLKLDYIKYPSRVNLGGYIDVDGVTTTTTNEFEISDDEYVYQVIDLAVLEAERVLERPDGVQISTQRISSNT